MHVVSEQGSHTRELVSFWSLVSSSVYFCAFSVPAERAMPGFGERRGSECCMGEFQPIGGQYHKNEASRLGRWTMILSTDRKVRASLRIWVGAAVLALAVLFLMPPAVAQTCNSGSATWTKTVPVDSPPTLVSLPQTFTGLFPEYFTYTTMFSGQPWASVINFSSPGFLDAGITINTGITVVLDVSGLSPGLNCFVITHGGIEIVPKNPNDGTPCGSNFDPKQGWFNVKTTLPWSGPCELEGTPDGLGYGSFLVAVNVVSSTNVSIVDPVPDLVSGNAVKTASQLQGLLTKGRVVSGVAADGVTQAIIRIQTNAANHQFAVKLLNDQNMQSSLPNEDGALGNPGDTSFSQSLVTVSSGSTGGDGQAYAFAVYRAPLDFARPTGAGFKSGTCNGANLGDDQLACRSVSLQVQDVTTNNSSPIGVAITILRPPVILIHGLWGDWRDWSNFSPLVKGANKVDKRFKVGRVSFDDPVGLTSSVPQYTEVSLSLARANSLGLQYNAPKVLKQIADWINDFKTGANPANVAVAAVQADVVAHSMGGLLVRTMPLLTQFSADPTYNQGPIHKVLTIDTPHLGSPLASLLLDPTSDCTRERLAARGYFSFASVALSGSGVNGAVGDLQANSQALSAIAQAGPHLLPTALIAGVYTNFASLNCTVNNFGVPCARYYIFTKCGSNGDVLGAKFSSTAWPLIFGPAGSNSNDAIVSQNSQLNGLTITNGTNGFIYSGLVHSPGTEKLSFTGPSVMDGSGSNPIANQVITLLNTPYTQAAFQNLNP